MNPNLLNSPELDELARLVAWSHDDRKVVYHGTRFGQTIIDANALLSGFRGLPFISFTASPRVAAYWSLIERPGDEGRGAVLVIDRKALVRYLGRFALQPAKTKLGVGPGGIVDDTEGQLWHQDVPNLQKVMLAHAEIRHGTVVRHDFLEGRWASHKVKLSPNFIPLVRAVSIEYEQRMGRLIEARREPWPGGPVGMPTVTFTMTDCTNFRLAALERLVTYLRTST